MYIYIQVNDHVMSTKVESICVTIIKTVTITKGVFVSHWHSKR